MDSAKKAQVGWVILILAIIVVAVILIMYYIPQNQNYTESIGLRNTSLGNILVDDNQMTLYVFLADPLNSSRCYDACADVWPPVLVSGSSSPSNDGAGVDLGVIIRTDGSYQVTADSMLLYTYFGDTSPGQVTGQGIDNFGGPWYVVSSSGEIITE